MDRQLANDVFIALKSCLAREDGRESFSSEVADIFIEHSLKSVANNASNDNPDMRSGFQDGIFCKGVRASFEGYGHAYAIGTRKDL